MIPYRPEVDGLRAVAIAPVILFHAGGAGFPGGYVGVDVFFVISGYLISSLIVKDERDGGFSYLDFYARRARRILPALLFMLLIVTLISFALLLPRDLIAYGKILIYTILFGANFRLAGASGYFEAPSQLNPLLHMWSLSVEEQFYLIWPTILVAILSIPCLRRRRMALLLLSFASLAAAEILVHTWPKSAFYHLPARGWELLFGAMLAVGAAPPVASRRLAEALSALGLALMIAPALLYGKDTVFPGVAALPPVVGCALAIHATSAFQTKTGRLLSLPPMVFVGKISYSLYLWHWPVFVFPAYLMTRETTSVETAALIGLSVLLATLSWRYVEAPFRKRRQAAASRSAPGWPARLAASPLAPAGYAAIALAACLIVSGSYFQNSKGAGWRLPDVLNQTSQNIGFTSCRAREIETQLFECALGGKTGERPEAILWGDSHAEHYVLTVAETYNNLKVYYQPSCAPILNVQVESADMPEDYRTCKVNKAKVFERIIAEKPAVVVLAGRWTLWEARLPWEQSRTPNFLVRDANSEMTLENNRKLFREELKNTVAALASYGIKVVIMGQTPELTGRLERCLAHSYYLNDGEYSCLSTPRSLYNQRQEYANQVFEEISKANESVRVFWPAQYLCNTNTCFALKDGKILYRDDNHLSTAGAMALAESFQSSLSQAFLPVKK